jgi:hypothetical protein
MSTSMSDQGVVKLDGNYMPRIRAAISNSPPIRERSFPIAGVWRLSFRGANAAASRHRMAEDLKILGPQLREGQPRGRSGASIKRR